MTASRCIPAAPRIAVACAGWIAAAWALAAQPAFAVPEHWVDNEWIRVTAEERRDTPSGAVLAIQGECKQQGFPEFVVTHLDDSGAAVRTEKSGKYCPREGAAITFLLPIPAAGSYRIEFLRIEGAM